MSTQRHFKVLLVEDDPSHAELTKECFDQSKIWCDMDVVEDGEEALNYLHKVAPYSSATTPDLIILDLNLPRRDGREVLREIKSDAKLKSIPVVVLTTSGSETDVVNAYELGANCYITKPITFNQFLSVIRQIEQFWLTVIRLPDTEDLSHP